VEDRLMLLLPRERWGRAHQLFVWHGRRTCSARNPACERCVLADLCPKVGVTARSRGATPRGSGPPAPRRARP
jgi:endonuclease-3